MTKWTKDEIEILKKLYPNLKNSIDTIDQSIPNHSWTAITKKAALLKVRRDITWSKEDTIKLQEYYIQNKPIEEICILLNKTYSAVKSKINRDRLLKYKNLPINTIDDINDHVF